MRAPYLIGLFAVGLWACGNSTPAGTASSGTTGSATSSTSGSTGTTTSTASGSGSSGSGSTGSNSSSSGSGSSGSSGSTGTNPLITARPYYSHAPTNYDPNTPLPLVVMLHGYSADHAIEGAYLGIDAQVDARQFFYAAPDGTIDTAGYRFWNATDACCNFYGSTVDDVAYLTAVVNDMKARYPIDPKRVFFVGHSNGAFMSHRMACERAGTIAAIVSLAGAQWEDATKCQPTVPVSVVEVHGNADTTISYNGGTADGTVGLPPFPSAPQTVATWADKDGCTGDPTDAGSILDIETQIPGAETRVSRYDTCPVGDVELWTIEGGSHIPALGNQWPGAPLDWLFAHPKP